MKKELIGVVAIALSILSEDVAAQTCGATYRFSRERAESNVFRSSDRPPSLRIIDCQFMHSLDDHYLEACAFEVDSTEFKRLLAQIRFKVEPFRKEGKVSFIQQMSSKLPTPLTWSYSGWPYSIYADTQHRYGLATYQLSLCPRLEEVITR